MVKTKGFGLLELVAALGVLAIILAVAVPNFLDWRASAELRSLTEELREVAKLTKSKAVQEGQNAVLDIDPDRDGLYNSYLAYMDTGNGSGGPPDCGAADLSTSSKGSAARKPTAVCIRPAKR